MNRSGRGLRMNLLERWGLARHRRTLNVVFVTAVVFILFIIANPRVFLNFNIYNAVMTSVPIIIFLALSMVFVVTCGEMDLSFGSVMGFAGLAFAWVTTKTGKSVPRPACLLWLCSFLGDRQRASGDETEAILLGEHPRNELLPAWGDHGPDAG